MSGIANGAQPAKKPLPIFFLIDVSGSMRGARIAAVNEAMEKLVTEFKKVANENVMVDFSVRVITYGRGSAKWIVGTKERGIVLENFGWLPIFDADVDGDTPADLALALLTSVMGDDYREYLGPRFSAPMVVLISDGQSNGSTPFKDAVDQFRASRKGRDCKQVAIGIDTQSNATATAELEYFGKDMFEHCTDEPEKITQAICFATVTTLIEQIKD